MHFRIVLLMIAMVSLTTVSVAQYEQGPPGAYGIVVTAGPAFPIGEFSDLFSTGFAGKINAAYNLVPEFQIFIGFGGLFWKVDNAKLNQLYSELGGTETLDVDAPYRMIPLSLGVNYVFGRGALNPYITVAFVVYLQKLELSGSITDGGTTTPITPSSDTWSQSAFAVGLGVQHSLGSGWGIDFGARFTTVVDYRSRVLIGTSNGKNITTRAIRSINLLGGISYTFE